MMMILALMSLAFAQPNPGVVALEHVERFTLQSPAEYVWNAARPTFATGTLFVVSVDADVAQVRQAGGKVLYVGDTPAARLNPGHLDGRIVAFIPGNVDLSKTPIYWGPPTLPEQIRPEVEGRRALEQARPEPFVAVEVSQALKPTQALDNEKHLHVRAATLIERYAPQDVDFARGYRAGWSR